MLLEKKMYIEGLFYFYCLSVSDLPACMSKHHIHTQYLRRLEGGCREL